MSLPPIHQEIQSFVKDPSSLFREKMGSDAKLAELSDEVLNVINDNSNSSFSLSREIGKISRDFLQKIENLPPEQRAKVDAVSTQIFLASLGIPTKTNMPLLREAILLLPENIGNQNIESIVDIFKSTAPTNHKDILRVMKEIPQDKLANLARNWDSNLHKTTLAYVISTALQMAKSLGEDEKAVSDLVALLAAPNTRHNPQTNLVILEMAEKERGGFLKLVSPVLKDVSNPDVRITVLRVMARIPEGERKNLLPGLIELVTRMDLGEKNKLTQQVFGLKPEALVSMLKQKMPQVKG